MTRATETADRPAQRAYLEYRATNPDPRAFGARECGERLRWAADLEDDALAAAAMARAA